MGIIFGRESSALSLKFIPKWTPADKLPIIVHAGRVQDYFPVNYTCRIQSSSITDIKGVVTLTVKHVHVVTLSSF